ncbi:DUF6252 family protein [Autumnicola edwardsiae]|uniref:DUF6252 family protein n=1 Tax=Autumnicola edwardsiae TaxID=3075594 RepID=A0ABU3CW68_9FLAO|nr:DUF6252 family protein [Zunongwangia sp. F297]MDT0650603.1 DUF6252 family protein [Zunongwangia sp. F297]
MGNIILGFSVLNKKGDRNESVGIFLKNFEIRENVSYFIGSEITNSNYALYLYGASDFASSSDFIGEIIFTKFDENTNIVAGTFWFDAVNEAGEMVEIREGRFDMEL